MVDLGCTEPTDRVTEGLLVLYGFEDVRGTTVYDYSGVGTPLDLTVGDPDNVTWHTGGGLSIDTSTIISSDGPASKVVSAVTTSNEITIEAWIQSASTDQNGPARVVTCSQDYWNRNFALGQGHPYIGSALWDVRLRTTETSLNGRPSAFTVLGSLTTELQHVVYTRDASGMARIYLDGVEVVSNPAPAGDMSNWDPDFRGCAILS